MGKKFLPRYPIYIPSKGRFDICRTADFLIKDGVSFRLVVEPQEADEYCSRYGGERILVLPFRDRGSVIPARNWIKDHATAEGHERHWQLDDNIKQIYRWYGGKRIRCKSGPAFAAIEDFVDRYENVAIAGMNYTMFAVANLQAFNANCHVYSCTLVLNSIPHRWRGRYNEDTDICLQVLADGWCTVLVNAFLADKEETMVMKGGNTDAIYRGDGRLMMARSLERMWPGVVETKRRFGRPQHFVYDGWKRFDTPLKLKPGLSLENFEEHSNEYGLRLEQIAEEIKSDKLKQLLERNKKALAEARRRANKEKE